RRQHIMASFLSSSTPCALPFAFLLALAGPVLGCSAEAGAPASAAPEIEAGPAPACEDGETRCDGDAVATCSAGSFGAAAPCEGDAVCKEGACVPPTDEQRAQGEELDAMLRYM